MLLGMALFCRVLRCYGCVPMASALVVPEFSVTKASVAVDN